MSSGLTPGPDRFAVIVGAMKCGTTALFNVLSQHPRIAPCRVKESDFFTAHWGKGLERYRSLWDWDPGRHAWALEASPNYTRIPYRPNAAERMASVDAEFRIVYLVRHPVRRAESQYMHAIATGVKRDWPADRVDVRAVDTSRYAAQIAEYRARFPEEHVLVLLFEDFADDPLATVARVERFLGIGSHSGYDLGVSTNPSSKLYVYPGLVYRLLNRFPKFLALARAMPKSVKLFFARRRPKRLAFTPAQERAVVDALRDDLRRLRDEFGVDISRWGLDV